MIRGLPGGIREVCGSGSLGTRGATGGIRGKLSHANLAAHSGLAGGIRDSAGVSLGTRGDSEGSRGSLLFSHSERWQVRVASGGSYLPGVLGDKCHLPKGLRKVGCFRLVSERGFRKAFSGGWHRAVRLEINGWDSSFRSNRLNCSERRWPSDSKWAAKIDSLDRAEAGIDRTGRKGRVMWTVGS